MQITVKADVKNLTRGLSLIQRRHIPLATAKALTFTAQAIAEKQRKTIPQIFSNPVRQTRKSVFFTKATLKSMSARVYIDDDKGQYKWLQHHIDGGARLQKGSERRNRLGPWTAMGKDAPKNAYGNITRARYSKMFADAQLAGGFTGDYASTKTKAAGGKKQIKYFKGKTKSGKDAIYLKSGGKRNPKITPMLISTSKPTYRKRWPFYKTVGVVSRQQFPIQFTKQLAREIKKAGF